MNILDNIYKTIPVIGKSWWTHFDNTMAVWFNKIHQNNLLYGENILDEKYLCAILEGGWKLLEVKSWMNIWQEYNIT